MDVDLMKLRKFETLSPFEIKDELIALAKKTSRTTQSAFLNAGRGNPNWIATAGLRAVQEESQSKLPALGYTVPYAVGNILLTAWGPVIVALMR